MNRLVKSSSPIRKELKGDIVPMPIAYEEEGAREDIATPSFEEAIS